MRDRTLVDISQYSYEEFISFLFAREVQPRAEQAEHKKWNPWFFHVEPVFDANRICEHYIRLFRQPAFLLTQYSRLQLDEGFWAIQASGFECSARRIIADTNLPFALREVCITSMADLFRDFFTVESLETAGNMWWDSLCYDWTCGVRKRERGGEDRLLQDVIFQTLSSILDLDSTFCHGAALHGLGHLHHPGTETLIQRFIDKHPELNEAQKTYAMAAAQFKIM